MGETEEGHQFSSNRIGDPESKIQYRIMNIPITLGYEFNRLSPSIGINYSYKIPHLTSIHKMHYSTIPESVSDANNYFKASHHIGLNSSVSVSLFKGISLGINYYHVLTNDFNYRGYSFDCTDQLHTHDIEADHNIEESLNTRDFKWKSRSITFSISYNLADLFVKNTD